MPLVGVYTRISEDTDGEGLGVARQLEDCQVTATQRGWTVAPTVYEDNDFSAYKAKKRPAFELMLADLQDGVIQGVVVYDLDRWARQPKDIERTLDIYLALPDLVFATVQGDIDFSTPDGITMARMLVTMANKASMDTARRVARKHLEMAQKGIAAGGNRPFGYKADRTTIDPEEAGLVVEAAQDILDGIALNTIARRWNQRGISTPLGHPWQRSTLRTMMISPRTAGYRVYRGGTLDDGSGNPIKGKWEPLLDEGTWGAVRAILTDPERTGRSTHVGGRKFLLSGIIRCSECGKTLSGGSNKERHTFSYQCKRPQECGKVAISGPQTDGLITDLVLMYLADQVVQEEEAPWPGEGELEEFTARVAELMTAYGEGRVSGDSTFPVIEKLEERIRGLREQRATWIRDQIRFTRRPSNVTESWPSLDTDQRRQLVTSVLHSVVVKPAKARGGRFDPERVSVAWRQHA